VERQRAELARRAKAYRGDKPPAKLVGRTVIVIDDGVATGATMAASLQALAVRKPALLVAAIPVAPEDAVERLRAVAGRVECLFTPEIFWSVGSFYDHFGQISDEQVIALLRQPSE
jgi:putative phosphoribosyl transferase